LFEDVRIGDVGGREDRRDCEGLLDHAKRFRRNYLNGLVVDDVDGRVREDQSVPGHAAVRIADAVDRGFDVFGGDGRAVMEFDALAKRQLGVCGRCDLPGGRKVPDDLTVDRVIAEQ